MESRICLLTAGPTGTETVKNLVLPGCGHVTVVDGEEVREEDVGNNFFVSADRVGERRGQVALDLLLELNEDVKGTFVDADPEALIGRDPSFFLGFDLVVATQLPPRAVRALGDILHDADIPLVVARTVGLLAEVRLSRLEHLVVEAHAEASIPDVRLGAPFDTLVERAEGIALDALEDAEHEHVPWPLILTKARLSFLAEHHRPPASKDDKAWIRAWITAAMREPDEPNFLQAQEHAFLLCQDPASPNPDLKDILEDPAAADAAIHALVRQHNEEEAPKQKRRIQRRIEFWIQVNALGGFGVESGFAVPLSGELPDMRATTEGFLELQELYAAQAREEREMFGALVDGVCGRVGWEAGVEKREQDLFVKNARSIRCLRLGKAGEVGPPPASIAESLWLLPEEEQPQAPLLWHLALRATDAFFDEHSRFPGSDDDALAEDTETLAALLPPLREAAGIEDSDHLLGSKHAAEIARYGGCEPHVTAAVAGAIAAQEATKLITAQFVPIDNTLVFNGVASMMKTVKL